MKYAKIAGNIVLSSNQKACVCLSGNREVKNLNHKWRGIKKPTNVLSFSSLGYIANDTGNKYIGDVILAFETVDSEARKNNISRTDHLAHLVIHGLLHILGFNHDFNREAKIMEMREIKLLSLIGIKNPYSRVV